MKYVLLLLVLLSQLTFARFDLDSSDFKEPMREEPRYFSYVFDIGLSKFFFLDQKANNAYMNEFSPLRIMPVFKAAVFYKPIPSSFFAFGIGLQASYLKATGKTLKDQASQELSDEDQELVYIPYQLFLDGRFFMLDSLLVADIWVGYEEAFIENRRVATGLGNAEGKAYISESEKKWNSYLSLGLSFGVSLKHFGEHKTFSGGSLLGLRDIHMKLYYEHNIDLKATALPGGRLVTDKMPLAKGLFGIAFSFVL